MLFALAAVSVRNSTASALAATWMTQNLTFVVLFFMLSCVVPVQKKNTKCVQFVSTDSNFLESVQLNHQTIIQRELRSPQNQQKFRPECDLRTCFFIECMMCSNSHRNGKNTHTDTPLTHTDTQCEWDGSTWHIDNGWIVQSVYILSIFLYFHFFFSFGRRNDNTKQTAQLLCADFLLCVRIQNKSHHRYTNTWCGWI